jgi:hypothetical protein
MSASRRALNGGQARTEKAIVATAATVEMAIVLMVIVVKADQTVRRVLAHDRSAVIERTALNHNRTRLLIQIDPIELSALTARSDRNALIAQAPMRRISPALNVRGSINPGQSFREVSVRALNGRIRTGLARNDPAWNSRESSNHGPSGPAWNNRVWNNRVWNNRVWNDRVRSNPEWNDHASSDLVSSNPVRNDNRAQSNRAWNVRRPELSDRSRESSDLKRGRSGPSRRLV